MKTILHTFLLVAMLVLFGIQHVVEAKESGGKSRDLAKKRMTREKQSYDLSSKIRDLKTHNKRPMSVGRRLHDKPKIDSIRDVGKHSPLDMRIRLRQKKQKIQAIEEKQIKGNKIANLQSQLINKLTSEDITEAWVQHYTSGLISSDDYGNNITIDASGNLYVTGVSYADETAYDYITIKYNSTGEVQWTARYNGPTNSDDYVNSIAVDASGNVYVTGCSYGSGTDYDFATIKYNSSGEEQWVARYDGPGHSSDFAYSIAVDANGNVYVTGCSGHSNSSAFTTIKYGQNSVSVSKEEKKYPIKYSLSQNYPNPFNPTTNVTFTIPERTYVNLKIFNAIGSEVCTLISELLPAGTYKRQWDASKLPSGIYFLRLQAGKFIDTKKLLLIK